MKMRLLQKRGTGGPPVSSRRVGILPTSFIRMIYRQGAKVAKGRRGEE
jgi:hypothetical protein